MNKFPPEVREPVVCHLVAATMDAVTAATGLCVLPTTTFAVCPRLDVLCIPGGPGVNALLADEATLTFVQQL